MLETSTALGESADHLELVEIYEALSDSQIAERENVWPAQVEHCKHIHCPLAYKHIALPGLLSVYNILQL